MQFIGILLILSGAWSLYTAVRSSQSPLAAAASVIAGSGIQGAVYPTSTVGDSGSGVAQSPDSGTVSVSSNASVAQLQQYAESQFGQYDWSSSQLSYLIELWNRESGWNYKAYNASSGATGIPQALPGDKMASAGSDWQTNPETQINWGLSYIQGRYGSPQAAWAHETQYGWY